MTSKTETAPPVTDQELRGRLDHHDQMLHDMSITIGRIGAVVDELAPLARRYAAMASRADRVTSHIRGGRKGATANGD